MVLWVCVGCSFCALVVNFLISSFQFLVEQYTPMLNSGDIDKWLLGVLTVWTSQERDLIGSIIGHCVSDYLGKF
jgi:hypothetical protein